MSAACMTWELAESGTQFITSVINGADLVPNFSAASVDDLRTEVRVIILVIFDEEGAQWLVFLCAKWCQKKIKLPGSY